MTRPSWPMSRSPTSVAEAAEETAEEEVSLEAILEDLKRREGRTD